MTNTKREKMRKELLKVRNKMRELELKDDSLFTCGGENLKEYKNLEIKGYTLMEKLKKLG